MKLPISIGSATSTVKAAVRLIPAALIYTAVLLVISGSQVAHASITIGHNYAKLLDPINSPNDGSTAAAMTLATGSETTLVIGSFSSHKAANNEIITASYSLHDGSGTVGGTHTRFLAKDPTAYGAGSVVGIKTGTSTSIDLNHSSTGVAATMDAGSTLTSLSLIGSGYSLSSGSLTHVGSTATTTSWEQVGGDNTDTGTFNVSHVRSGSNTAEIFITASFNVASTTAGTGNWELRVSNDDFATHTVVGNNAIRHVDAETGIVTMVGLADVDAIGNYEARLMQKASGTIGLTTSNISVAAVSLTLDEQNYLKTHVSDSVDGSGAPTLTIDASVNTTIFTAANITANSTADDIGTYRMLVGGTEIATSKREVIGGNDGSVGLVGVATGLSGSTTITLDVINTTTLGFDASSSNLIAFELTSIPEPNSVLMVIFGAGCFLLLTRNRTTRS